jgi:hypothetical protein
MFDKWLTNIHNKYDNEHLNHFEHNLEVWRELWRVTERATHVSVAIRTNQEEALAYMNLRLFLLPMLVTRCCIFRLRSTTL